MHKKKSITMKKILATVLLGLSLSASADNNPLWMRFSAISPDGQTIAFSYKGDIFTVPVNGGSARQLTTNPPTMLIQCGVLTDRK